MTVALMAVAFTNADSVQAQEPDQPTNVAECTDVLEILFGVPFPDCTPNVGSECFGFGGVDIVCAFASASVSGPVEITVAEVCPGDGQPNPPGSVLAYCWELTQSGGGWGISPGVAVVEGWRETPCPFDANENCDTGSESTWVETPTHTTTFCLAVFTEARLHLTGFLDFDEAFSCA